MIRHTPELTIQLARNAIPCQAGLQFGSRFVIDPRQGQVVDYLPDTSLAQVKNLAAFAGALALDKWTCNVNGRQAAFYRRGRERKYTAVFIDQGYSFNAGEWTFPDAPLRGVYLRNEVYEWIRGWDSFEPWLSRLVEELDAPAIWSCAEAVPPEWYGSDFDALERLVEALVKRRARVRTLILEFRNSSRHPFPNWTAVAEQGGTA